MFSWASSSLTPPRVVGHRVVRRTQHDTQVGVEGVGQVGDAGGRHDAEQQDVDAGGGQAGHDGTFEEVP
jgi:hypothetical protein